MPMERLSSSIVFLAVLLVSAGMAQAEAKRPPNVLLIMADDLGYETLGCYGGTSYRTPRLDALARGGLRGDQCHAMTVCHPTRTTLMTGRYPFRDPAGWGSFPKEARTFAHVLKGAGYATAVAGKWQLAMLRNNPGHPRQLGFDESCLFGWHEGPRYHQPLIWQNGVRRTELEKPDVYGPDVYCEFLIDFMTRHRQRPFFAYYPMALCHEIADDFKPDPPPAPDGHYLGYKEMVEDMDRIVGRLVDAVDRLGLRENTLIIFIGDNGSPKRYLTAIEKRGNKTVRLHADVISKLGEIEIHGGKGQLTDSGTRVPMIASWPGTIPARHVCPVPIDVSDFLPTLAELAGAELPPGVSLDGRSFAPQLRGSIKKHRRWIYAQGGNGRWVRTERWKLYNDGRLFDMENDPGEKKPVEDGDAREMLQRALESLVK